MTLEQFLYGCGLFVIAFGGGFSARLCHRVYGIALILTMVLASAVLFEVIYYLSPLPRFPVPKWFGYYLAAIPWFVLLYSGAQVGERVDEEIRSTETQLGL